MRLDMLTCLGSQAGPTAPLAMCSFAPLPKRRFDKLSIYDRVTVFLKQAAAARQTVTYGELAKTFGGIPNGWGPKLTAIATSLYLRGLPLLPVLVVRKNTGLPSTGAEIYSLFGITTAEDVQREQERCFVYDWQELEGTRKQL